VQRYRGPTAAGGVTQAPRTEAHCHQGSTWWPEPQTCPPSQTYRGTDARTHHAHTPHATQTQAHAQLQPKPRRYAHTQKQARTHRRTHAHIQIHALQAQYSRAQHHTCTALARVSAAGQAHPHGQCPARTLPLEGHGGPLDLAGRGGPTRLRCVHGSYQGARASADSKPRRREGGRATTQGRRGDGQGCERNQASTRE
jgi:hypothetical protein